MLVSAQKIGFMKTLIVIPMQEEIDLFLQACAKYELESVKSKIGRLSVVSILNLEVTLAMGGLGKVQFAVQTQHLLDVCTDWDLVICAGAAGALVDELAVGDIVVSTETVEYDILNHFGKPLLPRFPSAPNIVDSLMKLNMPPGSGEIHFGPVASGDEDVVNTERRKELYRRTGALAAAWEGAGGARACKFAEVPFAEIRGITDNANVNAAADFDLNLEVAMRSVASLIMVWLERQ